MSEKPITQRIKDRLAAYTAMLRDIDNQLERLDRMEMTMASPPGPDLTGMPRGSGTPSDRTGMMVERKMELEEQIDRLKAEEKQERNAIEGMILHLSDPDERAVIRLRYFDRADWESTCGVLFGDRRDYVDRVDAYQNRTYKIHGRALLNLAAVLDELLADGIEMLAALLAAGNLSFWLCDRALAALTRYYHVILKPKLKKKF